MWLVVGDFVAFKFKGSSFIEFPTPPVNPRTTSMTFSVSAQEVNGLILYMQPMVCDCVCWGLLVEW